MTARYRQRETPVEGRDHGHGKPLKSKSFWRRGGWTCAKTLTGDDTEVLNACFSELGSLKITDFVLPSLLEEAGMWWSKRLAADTSCFTGVFLDAAVSAFFLLLNI